MLATRALEPAAASRAPVRSLDPGAPYLRTQTLTHTFNVSSPLHSLPSRLRELGRRHVVHGYTAPRGHRVWAWCKRALTWFGTVGSRLAQRARRATTRPLLGSRRASVRQTFSQLRINVPMLRAPDAISSTGVMIVECAQLACLAQSALQRPPPCLPPASVRVRCNSSPPENY